MTPQLQEPEAARSVPAAKPEKTKETWPEFFASTAEVFVTGLFIITFIMQAFEIPSGSMLNTLLIGDHVFVDRVTHAPKAAWASALVPYRPIRHDEIIVFITPADPPGMYLVKRIVGLPGDRLKLVDGDLYRNGVKLTEPYAHHDHEYRQSYQDFFPANDPPDILDVTLEWRLTMKSHVNADGELVVPQGSYFGMGDNRDSSRDSRFWGFIPEQNVIGRPMFVYWSFDTPPYSSDRTLRDRAVDFLHTVTHFFTQTRWSRTFKMIR